MVEKFVWSIGGMMSVKQAHPMVVHKSNKWVSSEDYDGLERLLIAICNEPRIKELLDARIRERLEELVR